MLPLYNNFYIFYDICLLFFFTYFYYLRYFWWMLICRYQVESFWCRRWTQVYIYGFVKTLACVCVYMCVRIYTCGMTFRLIAYIGTEHAWQKLSCCRLLTVFSLEPSTRALTTVALCKNYYCLGLALANNESPSCMLHVAGGQFQSALGQTKKKKVKKSALATPHR